MDLTNSLSLSTNSDLTKQITELCRTSTLPGDYNPQHLPTELKHEWDSYEKQLQYHLGQALAIYQQKGTEIQVKLGQWWDTAYYYEPSELIGDEKWENLYPGVVVSTKPCRDFINSEANSEADQRYLTTQLITGALSKKGLDTLLKHSQRLVCALDPRDDNFFIEETLQECLERERLTTAKAINEVLGRKPYTQLKKADRRNALAQVWTARKEETLKKNQFLTENWEREDAVFSTLSAVRAFTLLTFWEVARSAQGYAKTEFETALWEVLREATEQGDEENYYLDPRDEDTWVGLRDLAAALRAADTNQFHNDYQDDRHTGQQWVRETALPTLYGANDDWWTGHPDVQNDPDAATQEEVLLTKTRRSALEETTLFRLQFAGSVKQSGLLQLAEEKYGTKLAEVLKGA